MKITKSQLKQIIREEKEAILLEVNLGGNYIMTGETLYDLRVIANKVMLKDSTWGNRLMNILGPPHIEELE